MRKYATNYINNFDALLVESSQQDTLVRNKPFFKLLAPALVLALIFFAALVAMAASTWKANPAIAKENAPAIVRVHEAATDTAATPVAP